MVQKLKTKYIDEVRPNLKETFQYTNIHQARG